MSISQRSFYWFVYNKFKAKYVVEKPKFFSSSISKKKIQEFYSTLGIPVDSKHDTVKRAFLDLAKKYHPDSGSPEADIDKFIAIEKAFRELSKYNTGSSDSEEIEKIVFDIRHTAPQHRQYLSFEGVGHGTPSQRMKQWTQVRAQKAAENVMEHRVAKSMASEKTLMKKGGQYYAKKHDIKTKYGFDRLVEDLIQESMSKGEFENLSGKGKPLKDQNRNPYVDFTTHKLNEVLINNGFTPEWITMNKEIEQDIELLRKELENDRKFLGPSPFSGDDSEKWITICKYNKELASSINKKIDKYNLIVPLLTKQRLHINFDKMAHDVEKTGIHSVQLKEEEKPTLKEDNTAHVATNNDDLFGSLFRAMAEVFSINKDEDKKKYKT